MATMGYFDGVHLGHQYLLNQLRACADSKGKPTLVVTFDNHPRTVLSGKPMPLLTTTQEKLLLLERQSVDACALLHFTHEMAQMSAKEFMQKILVDWLGVDTLVVGYDHRFGHNRSEGFDDYVRYGKEMGLSIEPAEALRLNGGESVCSSKIRECLSEGSIDKANEYLSRPYFMTGTVVEGRQVGRTIGYPTANLMLDDASKLVPKDGVYAVRVVVNDVHAYNAIMNIGTRPTLNDGRGRTIEIHLLDFSGSLYGARMRVEFIGFIRDERKFDNFEQLKHQISIDKADAIKIFR